MSPGERSGGVRERACRTVWADQREAHRLAGALLDALRARIIVEVRLGEAWAGALTLMFVDSSSIAMASVIAFRAVLEAG